MNEKLSVIFSWVVSGSIWIIFKESAELWMFAGAIVASVATVVLTILTAVRLRKKFRNDITDSKIKQEQLRQEEIRTEMLLREKELKFKK